MAAGRRTFSRTLRAFGLVIELSLAATLSCTGGGGGASPTPQGGSPAKASAAEVASARETLREAKLADEESIQNLESIRFTQAGVQAAAEALGSGVTGDELWAATWVYASFGTEPKVLHPMLSNQDPSIRLMAAAALVALGDRSGFDVLVRLIQVDDRLRGSRPPIAVGAFAAHTLERYTGVTLSPTSVASAADLAAAAAAWTDWLNRNQSSLRFDEATGMWTVE
jgi:hypothetical protein